MAIRPPVILRRRPVQPASLRSAAKVAYRAAPKTSAFPVLPAVAAAFILLGAAQMGFWWWEARLPGGVTLSETRSNPFLAITRSSEPPSSTGKLRTPERLSAPALPQNLQFGDAMARVTVTIFTDPSCGECREKVRAWTAGLPVEGVRQVYKFWPQDPNRKTPGMLVELARRQGVVPTFWRSLQGAGSLDLDDSRILDLLDRAGVPLADQRAAMVNDGASLMMSLEPDIKTAKDANLPEPPVILVEDYVLDGELLSPNNLGMYVKRLLGGRQLLERDNLWMMRK